eukprot:GFKZ01002282.1.p1 GENE.GFKZ01002282.1~~GFKZ01002282.1.p1  ORF type:complete len:337 (-),score=40.40 GFKZ01002282.1:559-1569(-)
MNADNLSDISQLLTGKVSASVRAATCATVAACSSGSQGASLRHLIGTTPGGEELIRRLLTLSADPSCARLALSALVNISEDERAALTITSTGGVQRVARALLDNDHRALHSLYAGMLSNLTRYEAGVDSLVGRGDDELSDVRAFGMLMGLVGRLDRIPNVLWMANVCVSKEGRKALIGGDHCPLNDLLKRGREKDEAIRLAAASAIRNCCLADEWHDALDKRSNAIEFCLSRLKICEENIAQELSDSREKAIEPVVEIRVLLAEALLLLCRSQVGRESLRRRDAYAVLEAWQQVEESQEVIRAVDSVLDRILAIEDGDTVEDNGTPGRIDAAETLD